MIEKVLLRTAAETATEAAGSSLARSLYKIPVTIGLSGALGSGKTAFMRGFLRAAGVQEAVTSPTYALEQRYGSDLGEVLHIDLYRLNESEARQLLHTSEHHPGIRCIEWPEKAGSKGVRADIAVSIAETTGGERDIAVTCDDVSWPSDEVIDGWRKELQLPKNVAAHCDAVGNACLRLAEALIAHGTFARPQFVRAAGKVHDLLRFVDFRESAAPAGWTSSDDEARTWKPWRERFAGKTHEEAVGAFLAERGYPELAALAASHSIHFPIAERTGTEEHILYYADKRVIGDRLVSITQRYDDFGARYGGGTRSEESLQWEREAVDTEKLLFPDGAPF